MKKINTCPKPRHSGLVGHVHTYRHHYLLGLLAVSIIIATFSLLPKLEKGRFASVKAEIANGAPAVDVLGQNDIGADGSLSPIFTKSGSNDSPSPYYAGPRGLVLDQTHHRLFVADGSNNRVLVYNLSTSTNKLPDHVPDFVLGQPNFSDNTRRTTRSGMSGPSALAYDAENNRLFVADSYFDLQSNNRVLIFDVTIITNGEDAVNVLGQTDFNSKELSPSATGYDENDANASTFNYPVGLSYEAQNKQLYVTDYLESRVLVFDVTPGTITDGEGAIDVLGQYDSDVVGSIVPVFNKHSSYSYERRTGLEQPSKTAVDTVHHRLFVGTYKRILVYNLDNDNNLLDQIPDFILGQSSFNDFVSMTARNLISNGVLAYDPDGDRLFVADTYNNRVLVFNVSNIANGQLATNVLGQADFTSSAAGLGPTKMNNPRDLAFDRANNRLFVAEYDNNRVLVFDTTNISDGQAAIHVIGQPDLNTKSFNNRCTASGFYYVGGLTYDEGNNRLFVSDYYDNRVLVFDVAPAVITNGQSATYVLGQNSMISCSARPTSQSSIRLPASMTYDRISSRLFVADNDNRVLIFDVTTSTIINGQNATHVLGQSDFTSSLAYTDQAHFSASGLFYEQDNDRLYLADGTKNRLLSFNVATSTISNGENADGLLGQTSYSGYLYDGGFGPIAFQCARASDIDSIHHRLFVLEDGCARANRYGGARVKVYNLDSNNKLVSYVADFVFGQADFYAADYGINESKLNAPNSLVYDAKNNRLFVGDDSRVMVFDVSTVTNGQTATHVLGQADFFTYDPWSVTQANTSYEIAGMAYDAANESLYVADSTNGRILVFDVAPGSIVDGANAMDLLGHGAEDPFTGIFVPDYTNNQPNLTNQRGMYQPTASAVDSVHHRLFVVDYYNNRVLVYNLGTDNQLTDRVPDNVIGQTDFTSSGAAISQSHMFYPSGVAYDPVQNNLFVLEQQISRVLVFDVSSITNGEPAVNVLGQTNFTSSGPGTTQSTLNRPSALTFDASQNRLFVSDQNNHRVMVFDVSAITNGENAVQVLGKTNFITGGILPPSQLTLRSPSGLTYDVENNRLFVSDAGNNRVMVFDATSITNGEPAINVLGQNNFTTNGYNFANESRLYDPSGLAYDETTKLLFVSDKSTNNNRVMVINVDPATIANGKAASYVLGQPDFVSSGAAATQTGLKTPLGLACVTSTHRLYVADSNNNRVMVFDVSVTPPGQDIVVTDGTYTVHLKINKSSIATPLLTNAQIVDVWKQAILQNFSSYIAQGITEVDVTYSGVNLTSVSLKSAGGLQTILTASGISSPALAEEADVVVSGALFDPQIIIGNRTVQLSTDFSGNLQASFLSSGTQYATASLVPTSADAWNSTILTPLMRGLMDTTVANQVISERVSATSDGQQILFRLSSNPSNTYLTATLKNSLASFDHVLAVAKTFQIDPTQQFGVPYSGVTAYEFNNQLILEFTGLSCPGTLTVKLDASINNETLSKIISDVMASFSAISCSGDTLTFIQAGTTITVTLTKAGTIISSGAYDPTKSGPGALFHQGVNVLVRGATVGTNGTAPGQTPLAGAVVKAYLTSVSCVATNANNFDNLNASCRPTVTCTTASDGTCTLYMAPGSYRILSTSDQFPGLISKDANLAQVKLNIFDKKNYMFIKTPDGRTVGGSSQVITGSELWVYQPEAVLWDTTTAYYPFVFESDSDWSINVCLNPPEGYQVDHGSQDCIQTGVANESKAVLFKMVEVGSVPADTAVSLTLKHQGKSQVIKSKIPARLTSNLAKKKGLNIDQFGRVK